MSSDNSHALPYLKKALEEALLVVDVQQSISGVDDIVMARRKVHGQAVCNLERDLHRQSKGCIRRKKEGNVMLVTARTGIKDQESAGHHQLIQKETGN